MRQLWALALGPASPSLPVSPSAPDPVASGPAHGSLSEFPKVLLRSQLKLQGAPECRALGAWRLVSVGDHPWLGIGVQEVGPDSGSQEGQWPGWAVEVSVREWPLPPSFEHPHALTRESHVYELAHRLTRIYNPQTAAVWEHAQGRKHFESLRSRSPAEVEGGDALPPGFNPTP